MTKYEATNCVWFGDADHMRRRLMKAVYKKVGLLHRVDNSGAWCVHVCGLAMPLCVTQCFHTPMGVYFSAPGRPTYRRQDCVVAAAPGRYAEYL
jgi:hypothetical protein